MKRFLILTLCILLALIAVGCDKDNQSTPTDPPHEHTYTCTESSEPTCKEEGKKVYTCECGETYTDTVPVLAHTFGDWHVTANPTMTTTGTESRECSVCGSVENKELPMLTAEEALANYADIICSMPAFNSVDELYGGALMDWVLMNVDTISSEWSDVTFLVTKVYSLDEIDRMTTHYFGKTFDFLYLIPYDESLSYDQQNNTLTWVLGAAGGWPYYTAETVTKIDDTHYTLRYAGTYPGDEQPFCYGTLSLELEDGRFIIRSNTVES